MSAAISKTQIRIRMAEAGIHTVTDLGQRSGVSRPKLYSLMDNASPYQTALLKVAEALGVNPEDLIDSASSKE